MTEPLCTMLNQCDITIVRLGAFLTSSLPHGERFPRNPTAMFPAHRRMHTIARSVVSIMRWVWRCATRCESGDQPLRLFFILRGEIIKLMKSNRGFR